MEHLLIFDYINFCFYSKQMYLKSLPENGKSIKEIYLSFKAKELTLSVKQNTSLDGSFGLARAFKSFMLGKVGLSSQVVEDYMDIFKLIDDSATRKIPSFVMMISSKCNFFLSNLC